MNFTIDSVMQYVKIIPMINSEEGVGWGDFISGCPPLY